MPNVYHKNVEQGLLTFGKKYKRFVKFLGTNDPIHINHPTKRMFPILYRPDVHFVTRVGKRYIFEILDSELKDDNLIISNILQACLSPNTSNVVFIVPREIDQDRVMDLALTVVDNLVIKGFHKNELPRVIAAFYILRKEAKTPEDVTEVLVRGAKDIGVIV